MLKKALRLTTEEIETLSQGKSVFGTLISLRYIPADTLKFAVAASKKVFKTAVDRNHARRRVYDAVDVRSLAKARGAFVMFMPKKECLEASTVELKSEIASLLSRVL